MYVFTYCTGSNWSDGMGRPWCDPVVAVGRNKKKLLKWAVKYCIKQAKLENDEVLLPEHFRLFNDSLECMVTDEVYGWITSGVKEIA